MKYPDSYIRSLKPGERERLHSGPADAPAATEQQGRTCWRELAVAADAASTMDISLALLWRELVHGICHVVDGFFTEDRCCVILAEADAPVLPLEGRRLAILEAVLCGHGQKAVAIDFDLAPSTIALNARLGLEYLGLRCKPSRVHPLLMVAAKAGSKSDGMLAGTLSRLVVGERQLRVVALPRPDRRLFKVLPPAELAVTRLLVEGYCYEDMARLRGTATRTVANQLTAVFRRMRVSGRNELLARLFFSEGMERTLLTQLADAHATSRASADAEIVPSFVVPLRRMSSVG
jgi:DNA-binding NarL/FixJ family response regulator